MHAYSKVATSHNSSAGRSFALLYYLLVASFLFVFISKEPSLDRHIPSLQEFSKVLLVNAVMTAGKAKCL